MFTSGHILVEHTAESALARLEVRRADNFISRFIGLLTTANLGENEGLLLPKTRQVHTFAMRYAIDLVFVNGGGQVIYIQESVPPWKISRHVGAAAAVLELRSGQAKHFGIQVGDRLQFQVHDTVSEQLNGFRK